MPKKRAAPSGNTPLPKRSSAGDYAAAAYAAEAAAAAAAASYSDQDSDEAAAAASYAHNITPDARERMREAVRKCRQRKRERTERLRNEAIELAKENATLRTQLEMGSETLNLQKVSRGMALFKEMVALLATKQESEDTLKHVVEVFNERYVETGRDKMAALKYVTHGLSRLLKPADLTTVHLHFLSQSDDSFYQTDPMWKAVVKELALTQDQVSAILARRAAGRRAKAEVWYTMQRMAALEKTVLERDEVAARFMTLNTEALKPWQFAELLRWSHTNPAGKEFLEILWNDLVGKIDAELDCEREAMRKTDPDALQVQVTLDELRLENVREIKRLFTLSLDDKAQLHRIGRKIFAESGVLIDPSNGGEYDGVDGFLNYVEKMRRAFTASNGVEMHFEERSVEVNKDKILAKFFVRGSYLGKLSEGDQPIPTSLDSVMSVSFAEGSHQIKEIVVSNDMVGLFLGLGHGAAQDGFTVRRQTPDPTDAIVIKSQRLEDLKRLFETDGERPALLLAQRLLTQRCVFIDSNQGTENKGPEECCAYLGRLRKAFPKLVVSASNTEQISPTTFKCEWVVAAEYGGALAKQQKRPCTLKGVLFVTMEDEEDLCRISLVRMVWDASSLLRELGVSV